MSPTGYTYEVETGEIADLRTFALRCARAFGPTGHQRDHPLGEAPKPEEVSASWQQSLERSRAESARLNAMSQADAEAAAEAEYRKQVAAREESIRRNRAEQLRYQEMIVKVEQWTPPSSDHLGLKAFMLQQLQESMRFNEIGHANPERKSWLDWLREAKSHAEQAVERETEMARKAHERVAAANLWIKQLYDSLPSTEEGVLA